MADVLTYFEHGTSTPFSMNMAGLADGQIVASAVVDNSSTQFVDALVQFKFKVEPGASSNWKNVYVYFYSSEDGVNFPDDVPPEGGLFSLRAPSNLIYAQSISVDVKDSDDFDSYMNGVILGDQPGWRTPLDPNGAISVVKTGALGQVTNNATGSGAAISIAPYIEDQYSEITMGLITAAATDCVGVVVAAVELGAITNYYHLYYSPGANAMFTSVTLQRWSGGGNTGIVNTTPGVVAFVAGDVLRLERAGTGAATRLTAKKNGVAITGMNNVDPGAPYLAGGVPGIWAQGNALGVARAASWRSGLLAESTYVSQPISVASFFNARMPRFWGIAIRNLTGLSFTATGADHLAHYTGVYMLTS